MFDGSLRKPIDAGLRPVGEALRRAGVSADVITVAGIVMAGACAVAIGTGHFLWAVVLLALAGVPDALDGAVAKAGNTATKRGAFFDSVSDRFTDAILFGGVAWYLAGQGGRAVMLAFALYAAASLGHAPLAAALPAGEAARVEDALRGMVAFTGLGDTNKEAMQQNLRILYT